MSSNLALLIAFVSIFVLFRMDRKEFTRIPAALWLPLLYAFILASRLPSQWFLPDTGDRLTSYQDGNGLDRAIYIGILLASVVVLSRRRAAVGELLRNNWVLVLFLGYAFLSVAWSDFPGIAFKRWVRDLGIYTTAGVVATDPDAPAAIRLLFRRLSYLVLPLSVVAIKYFPDTGRGFDFWTGEPSNFGISTSKNGLGAFALICGLYLFWECLGGFKRFRYPSRERLIHVGLLGAALLLLKQSESATSQVCFAIGVAYLILNAALPRSFGDRAAAVIVVLVALFVVPLNYLFDLSGSIVRLAGRDPTLTGRTELWTSILNVPNSPIFGVGYESFWLGDRIARLWREHPWGPNQAHNGYLEIYVNLGMIGLVLLIWMYLFYFRRTSLALAPGHFSQLVMSFVLILPFYCWTEAAFKAHIMWHGFLIAVVSASLIKTRGSGMDDSLGQPRRNLREPVEPGRFRREDDARPMRIPRVNIPTPGRVPARTPSAVSGRRGR